LRVPTLRKVTVAAEDEDQEKELESKRKVGDDDDDDDDKEEDWIQIRKNDLEKETTVAKASSRSEKSTIQEVVTVDPAERSLYIH
jgi:hypothetical protein